MRVTFLAQGFITNVSCFQTSEAVGNFSLGKCVEQFTWALVLLKEAAAPVNSATRCGRYREAGRVRTLPMPVQAEGPFWSGGCGERTLSGPCLGRRKGDSEQRNVGVEARVGHAPRPHDGSQRRRDLGDRREGATEVPRVGPLGS
jgi:hypothetical protein